MTLAGRDTPAGMKSSSSQLVRSASQASGMTNTRPTSAGSSRRVNGQRITPTTGVTRNPVTVRLSLRRPIRCTSAGFRPISSSAAAGPTAVRKGTRGVLELGPDREQQEDHDLHAGDGEARAPDWAVGYVPGGSREVVLRGDLLLLVTDGVLEAPSPEGEAFETERVQEVVRRHADAAPGAVVDAIYRALGDYSQGKSARDDVTLVAIRFRDAP